MSEVRSSRRSGISSNLYVLAMVLIEIDTHISFNGSQTEPEPGTPGKMWLLLYIL